MNIHFIWQPRTGVVGGPAAYTLVQHANRLANVNLTLAATRPGVNAPIRLAATPGDAVYLVLFGTGLRNRSALANFSVVLNGTPAVPLYAGAQVTSAGLNQANVMLPSSLSGAGTVQVSVRADG